MAPLLPLPPPTPQPTPPAGRLSLNCHSRRSSVRAPNTCHRLPSRLQFPPGPARLRPGTRTRPSSCSPRTRTHRRCQRNGISCNRHRSGAPCACTWPSGGFPRGSSRWAPPHRCMIELPASSNPCSTPTLPPTATAAVTPLCRPTERRESSACMHGKPRPSSAAKPARISCTARPPAAASRWWPRC